MAARMMSGVSLYICVIRYSSARTGHGGSHDVRRYFHIILFFIYIRYGIHLLGRGMAARMMSGGIRFIIYMRYSSFFC